MACNEINNNHASYLSFIYSLIKSSIIDTKKESAFVCFNLIKLLYDPTNFIVLMWWLSYFITLIRCFSIQSKFDQNREVGAFICFNFKQFSYHSFDAFTFVVQLSCSLFCWFNWTSLGTSLEVFPVTQWWTAQPLYWRR